MENTRFLIAQNQERITKYIHFEFEFYPVLWVSVYDSFQSTSACCASLRQYADITRLDNEKLRALLASSDITSDDIEIIILSDDRQKVYQSAVDYQKYRVAARNHDDLSYLYSRGRLFLDELAESKVEELRELIRNAPIEWDTYKGEWLKSGTEDRRAFQRDGKTKLDEVRLALQTALKRGSTVP